MVYAHDAVAIADRAIATLNCNVEADTSAIAAQQDPAAARIAAKAAFERAKDAYHRAHQETDSVAKQAAVMEAISAKAAAEAAIQIVAPPQAPLLLPPQAPLLPPPPAAMPPPQQQQLCAICGKNPLGGKDWRPQMGDHRCVRCGRYWIRNGEEWHAGVKRGGAR